MWRETLIDCFDVSRIQVLLNGRARYTNELVVVEIQFQVACRCKDCQCAIRMITQSLERCSLGVVIVESQESGGDELSGEKLAETLYTVGRDCLIFSIESEDCTSILSSI